MTNPHKLVLVPRIIDSLEVKVFNMMQKEPLDFNKFAK